jgi:hypothetical protein
MTIGILTQPINNNYGGIMQNYALQKVLKGLGYDVVTLNWDSFRCFHCPRWWILQNWLDFKVYISKKLLHRHRNSLRDQRNYYYQLSLNNRGFSNRNLVISDYLWHYGEFREYIKYNNIKIIIVGSDQVWRPKYNIKGMIYRMFLDFTIGLHVKRIAYAASFGDSLWEFKKIQTIICKNLLRQFDAVSVREDSGIRLCSMYLDRKDVTCTLDPTLLLNKDNYIELLKNTGIPSTKKELLVYMLDCSKNKLEIAKRISYHKQVKIMSFTPKYCNLGIVRQSEIEDYITPSVDVWLRGFYDAKYVVCDSFHGMVFSIIFNKPFIVICNKKRGQARFTSLLKKIDLEERLISEDSNNYLEVLDIPIKWEIVNSKLNELRKESIDFIYKSLIA